MNLHKFEIFTWNSQISKKGMIDEQEKGYDWVIDENRSILIHATGTWGGGIYILGENNRLGGCLSFSVHVKIRNF